LNGFSFLNAHIGLEAIHFAVSKFACDSEYE
jgi:hypothetical protein